MQDFFVEAHISDIHFGAMDPKEQYKLLKDQFIDRLMSLPILDIVSVNGDIFHHKFMANSESVSLACYFISDLIKVCAIKNATLLIIAGTYSHDADQIKLFYPMAEQAIANGTDVRIIEEVKFETVKGKRILCIPELYGKGSEYYEQFLYQSGFYDACYMHGTFVGAIFGKDIPNLNSDREPVFYMDHFRHCAGPIISGHVHTPGCYAKHFYYCGSPYRWQFGEEEEKGFIIMMQDMRTRQYAVHYEPIISDKYITINLDSMINGDPKDMIAYIAQTMKEEDIKYLRVRLTENNPENLEIIQTFYRNNPNVRIETKILNDNIVQNLQEIQNEYENYDYLFDKNITPENKLVRYINQSEGSVFLTYEDLIGILQNI